MYNSLSFVKMAYKVLSLTPSLGSLRLKKKKKKFLKIIALSCYFQSFPTAEGFLKICPTYDSQVQSSFYKTGYWKPFSQIIFCYTPVSDMKYPYFVYHISGHREANRTFLQVQQHNKLMMIFFFKSLVLGEKKLDSLHFLKCKRFHQIS